MIKEELTPYVLGKEGEKVALQYLKNKKCRIVTKNFRMYRGEIDIIAYDRKALVFVEVKTRKSRKFGLPEESVTFSKQKQIKKIACGFLVKNNLQDVECRFDVLSLHFDEDEGYTIHHIKNAF